MSIRRLLIIARKEFRHIVRDARLLFLVAVAPAFLLTTLSYVFALDVGRVDVAIHDLDRTPLSREFVSRLSADEDFVIVVYVQREEEVESLLTRGAADLILVIPHGFTDAALAGGPAELHAVIDGADSITAGQTLGLLQIRVNDFVVDLLGQRSVDVSMGVQVSDRAWYNETLKSIVSMVPGMLAIIMCMPALALTLALAREKETGSFEGLVVTPVRGTEYLVGKMLAYVVGGAVSFLLAWLVAIMWFAVPFRGNLIGLLTLVGFYLFASMGLSLMIANFVRNQQTAMFLVLMVFFVPSFFIAGLITPVADEPIARALAQVLPTTHFITVSRGVFLKGLGVAALKKQALALLALGAASLAASLAVFRKRVR
jgi:ABC-2 type transport system permease protein